MCNRIFTLRATMSQQKIVETMYAGQSKLRTCLRCDSKFMSEFNGNRICTECKTSKQMVRDLDTDWSSWPTNYHQKLGG